MKCDLHVHTIHSGMCTVPVAKAFCRESYNQPEAIYEKLKRTGMDLVTVTDHDSIDAAEVLRRHPDFFLSEEVTCRMPSGGEVHVGVYDITEQQHTAIQSRRTDMPALLSYLREQRLVFGINHLLSSLTGPRDITDYEWFERSFPCFEVLNGAMLACSNERAASLARWMRKSPLAGSDAHTLRAVGSAYTDVPGARSRAEFVNGLRRGAGIACGTSGSYWKLTSDVLAICAAMVREKQWTAVFSPLFAAVPAIIFVNYYLEVSFAHKWFDRVLTSSSLPVTGAGWNAEEASA